jgi:hypothetical protein
MVTNLKEDWPMCTSLNRQAPGAGTTKAGAVPAPEYPGEGTLGGRFPIEHFGGIVLRGNAVIGDDRVIRNGLPARIIPQRVSRQLTDCKTYRESVSR